MRPFSHFGSFVAALAFVLILATAGAAVDLARAGTIPASDVARVRAHAGVSAELVHTASAASTSAAQRLSAFGNTVGHAYAPPAARAVNTSHPDSVIGRGTPRSCTSAAVVRAVARGGVITFNCGRKPVTITMT